MSEEGGVGRRRGVRAEGKETARQGVSEAGRQSERDEGGGMEEAI